MVGVLDSVNQRTQLVGQNRLELLLFTLGGSQYYGINVFKVKEVLQCPHLTEIPKRNPVVRGVAHIRGGTIPIMDLRQATGGRPLKDITESFVIITEYNCSTQGFLVKAVDRIVNLNWGDVHPPPRGAGRENFLTAVADVEGHLVEIIDVEKVLAEVSPLSHSVSAELIQESSASAGMSKHVLVVDDSTVARKQVQKVVESLGMQAIMAKDGKEALDIVEGMLKDGKDPAAEFSMVISDIEMPEMDGYTFTASLRTNPATQGMYIILHTSLSGVFNQAMVKKVGADDFLAKFHPDELARRVNARVRELAETA